jgi:phage shock protein A
MRRAVAARKNAAAAFTGDFLTTMSIFARFREIVETSIDAVLERSDNPARTLRLMIQEMEDALVEMKSSCAGVMAEKTKAERSLDSLSAEEKRWMDRAELAVARGRDDMAREALLRRRGVVSSREAAEAQAGEFSKKIHESQEEIARVDAKLRQAREKLASLQDGEAKGASAPAKAQNPPKASVLDDEIEKELSEIREYLKNTSKMQ